VFHTSGFALETCAANIVSANWRASLPLEIMVDQSHRQAQFFFCTAAYFYAAVQKQLKNSSLILGIIEGSAVKKGIGRKNHMPAGGRHGGFKPQRTFLFFRGPRHIGPDSRQVLSV